MHTVYGHQGGVSLNAEQRGALNHYNLLLTDEKYNDFLATMPAPSIQDGEISVYSDGNALDTGMLTTGTNKIFLGASGTYTQEAVYDYVQCQEIKKKRRFNKLSDFAKTRRLQSKRTSQVARPCTTISTNKKAIDLYGGKGVSLRGSVLKGGKLTIEAKEGLIHLLTTLGMECVEVKKSSKDPLWQSKSQSFEYDEDRQQCQFPYDEAQGSIEFKTPEGIVVELVTEKHSHADGKKNKGRPQEWQRLKDFSNTPGYEWIKLLDERDDVVRIYVDERHDSGHFAHQGMSAAAKVVASIVLTICTGGAGSILTMITSSLMNSMIINTVDQRGHVDRAAKTTFSKESLKGLGAQILGQALLSGLDMVGESLSKAASTATQATAQTATQAATKVAPQSATWVDRFQTALSSSLKTNVAKIGRAHV